MNSWTCSGNSRTCGAWQRKQSALSLPAGDARNASSDARNAGEWIERDKGEVSHSSNTRSWQRLHLVELGKALSIVIGALPSCCAKSWSETKKETDQARIPPMQSRNNTALAVTVRPAAGSRHSALFALSL